MPYYLGVVGVISVMIAAIAAIAAWWAAYETKKASFAQFVLEDTGTYGSPEMLRAIIILTEWQKQHPEDHGKKFGELRKNDYLRVKDLDEARRRVSYYFLLPEKLLKFNSINEEIKDKLRDEDQVDLYLKLVKPLDEEVEKAAER